MNDNQNNMNQYNNYQPNNMNQMNNYQNNNSYIPSYNQPNNQNANKSNDLLFRIIFAVVFTSLVIVGIFVAVSILS